MTFGDRVRAGREAMGVSCEGLAEMCGLSTASIYNIEGGRSSPRKKTIGILCSALGIEDIPDGPPAIPEPEPPGPIEEAAIRGEHLLAFIDKGIETLQNARMLLVPDETDPVRAVPSRDMQALARRLAAAEDALQRHGLMQP